jgi:hypothetical protein
MTHIIKIIKKGFKNMPTTKAAAKTLGKWKKQPRRGLKI